MSDEFDGIELVDRLKIMDCLARYSWALDGGDLKAYLACFDEEGTLRHPLPDGSPGAFTGHRGIEEFIGPGFARRSTQGYGHQHQFNAVRMTAEQADISVDAYAVIFRHEFHRQYWPRGASWRMGTWHALFRRRGADWKIKDLDVRMWTDTAFNTGTAIQNRGPGMPGTRD